VIDNYTPEMATAAVERGAAWLDEHCPDWVMHIDLTTLELGNQSACVLGQMAECFLGKPVLGRRFTRVLDHFEQGTTWAEIHGFDVPIHRFDPDTCGQECYAELKARYEMLTLAWLTYVRQRVETPA
jgi:hypothetical protein